MYVYKYSVDVYLLCMIKVRVMWYTCSLRRMLQPLVNCSVSPSSSSFLLTCIITTTRNELARLGMGTSFLVYNSASEAKLTNRRENFKFYNKYYNKYSLENLKSLEMPPAYVRPTTLMRMNNSYKLRVDDRRCPVRNVC